MDNIDLPLPEALPGYEYYRSSSSINPTAVYLWEVDTNTRVSTGLLIFENKMNYLKWLKIKEKENNNG